MTDPVLRVATLADADRIEVLMKESAAAIFPRWYDEQGAASAVEHVAVVDRMLLEDGTYFVLEAGGEIVACGGWSRPGSQMTRRSSRPARGCPTDSGAKARARSGQRAV